MFLCMTTVKTGMGEAVVRYPFNGGQLSKGETTRRSSDVPKRIRR